MNADLERRERAIAAFREANARDPHLTEDRGVLRPRELVASERLLAWVLELDPEASEALVLASHCQHLCRWELPRAEFPPGRLGYLKWRKALSRFHAERAGEILAGVGYDAELRARVRQINLKLGLQHDVEVQTMEDALCLSFLQNELAEFSTRHPEPKLIAIIAKTWRKMSPRARELALSLPLEQRLKELVAAALAAGSDGAAGSDPADQ